LDDDADRAARVDGAAVRAANVGERDDLRADGEDQVRVGVDHIRHGD
jgi:hypothetical protein